MLVVDVSQAKRHDGRPERDIHLLQALCTVLLGISLILGVVAWVVLYRFTDQIADVSVRLEQHISPGLDHCDKGL